jgi:hypothetical protein
MTAKSIQDEENEVSEKLFPELKAHLNYVNDVYNLAFRVQESIDGKAISDIAPIARSCFMILMRITDFLQCTQLLSIKGYPEQAGTLAASIFELAHTAQFFSHSPNKAKEWLEAESIWQEAPRNIPGKTIRKLVKANCENVGDVQATEREYQVYQQLCWMKHSLPKMQDMRVTSQGVGLVFGPHLDERAMSHAWFSMEHAGRLTEMVIALLMPEFGTDATFAMLQQATEVRDALRRRAIDRFGSENPFAIDPRPPKDPLRTPRVAQPQMTSSVIKNSRSR